MKLFKIFLFFSVLSFVLSGCSVNHKNNSETVALKAFNGKFVGFGAGTIGLKLVATKDKVGDWERFSMFHKTGNLINLQLIGNLFVCADYGMPGEYLVADKLQASDWETFTFEDLGNNTIALKASNGKYISVDAGNNNLLSPNKDKVGVTEKFTLVKNP